MPNILQDTVTARIPTAEASKPEHFYPALQALRGAISKLFPDMPIELSQEKEGGSDFFLLTVPADFPRSAFTALGFNASQADALKHTDPVIVGQRWVLSASDMEKILASENYTKKPAEMSRQELQHAIRHERYNFDGIEAFGIRPGFAYVSLACQKDGSYLLRNVPQKEEPHSAFIGNGGAVKINPVKYMPEERISYVIPMHVMESVLKKYSKEAGVTPPR